MMVSPNLPTNIDENYADNGGDASVKLHQQYHDAIHRVVNRFDAAQPWRIPVAARAVPGLAGLSDGSVQGRLYKTKHRLLHGAHSLQVAYSNFYIDTTNADGLGYRERDGVNDITVYAAAGDYAGIDIVRLTPPGGAVLKPGEVRWFDLPIEVVDGEYLYLYNQVAVGTAGHKWPLNINVSQPDEGIVDTSGAPTTDVTLTTGTGVTYSPQYGFGPTAIAGRPIDGPIPSILVLGPDVISAESGYANNALTNASIPYYNISMAGSSAALFAQWFDRYRRMTAVQDMYFSACVFHHISHDLGYGGNIHGNMVRAWQVLARRGMKVYALTAVPRTTDSGGTTPGPNESWRVLYNDWLRAGAPVDATMAPLAVGAPGAILAGVTPHPLTGYFEAADLVETSRNSGQWLSLHTDNGLEPSTIGHTALQAALNLTTLRTV